MTTTTEHATTGKRVRRPRASRYVGRTAREILIADEQDAWIEQQMAGKWSRNAIVEQCINIAMGKVDAATDQSDAVAATLVEMRADIDKVAHQLRMVLAILNFDTRLRYLPPEQRPVTYTDRFRNCTAHGRCPMIPLSDRERVEAERLLNNALGAEIQALAAQAGVEDIAINPDGRAFVYGSIGKRRLETRFDADRRSQIVTLSARFAGVVAEGKGRLSFAADLPGQIRFQGGIQPRSIGGPYVVLRFLPKVVRTFQDYIDDGVAPMVGKEVDVEHEEHEHIGLGLPTMDCIAEALARKLTIVVFGETGSGKSSLLMSMANHPAVQSDRLVTLEDTPEMQFPCVEDVLGMCSVGIDMPDLLKDGLRCRPDRVILGEARDGAFWTFVLAQYTGHRGGLVTLHANNPADFFDRIEQMVAQAGIDPIPQRRVLMKTLQRIVWIKRRPGGGRDIVGVYRPDGYDAISGYRLSRVDVPHRP
jgi:Flp pilus assembly CpaF family ATPase